MTHDRGSLGAPSHDPILSYNEGARRMLDPMNLPRPNLPPGFDQLSVAEKIDLVQSLWDRIASEPDAVPVPDWHQRQIRERLEAGPGESGDWGTVRERIEKKLRGE